MFSKATEKRIYAYLLIVKHTMDSPPLPQTPPLFLLLESWKKSRFVLKKLASQWGYSLFKRCQAVMESGTGRDVGADFGILLSGIYLRGSMASLAHTLKQKTPSLT